MSYNTSPEMRDLQNDVEKLQEDLVDKVFRHVMKDSFRVLRSAALMPAAKSLTAVRKIVCKKCQLCKTLLKTKCKLFNRDFKDVK